MGAEFLLMDDNARPHRANIVDECLQSEDIIRMDWPAYSPDLNPIEHVCICDVKEETAKEFLASLPPAEGNKVIFQKCDVTSAEELRSAFERVISIFGGIDVVINNAGIVDEQNWERMIDVNFIGVVHGIKLGFEYMGKGKGGHGGQIINTASRAGLNPKYVWAPIYCATKSAVVGLTRSYGSEYHFNKTGVAVNAICPAFTDTELLRMGPRREVDDAGSASSEGERTLKPEEVAQALIQLLEDGKNGALLLVETDGVKYV
ncbi:15-hydroxyprostaglandin dehydrogenase [NAD(+)] [Araneus ventricosus]|uniref:15-hydroxyprostaglandin dehydrogenase [NAD(+)] n=1 Tax=Araneus ventricosus TaxID=182803 RepID=A0A4Y2IBJ8_ARAVE|nr:15-hydroxyprostaglandin dehydrogenase [NAD(+)] [Araneus ventricosus]